MVIAEAGLTLGLAEFRPQRRDVHDSEEEGLPELANERAGAPSENAHERDALHQMDRGEYDEECAAEAAEGARFERLKETGRGREPDRTDDGLADRIDFFIFQIGGLQCVARMIASPSIDAA